MALTGVPVYEFRCAKCGSTIEELLPAGSGPSGPCPSCGGELRRVWSRVGVRFRGWGFRSTDSLVPGDRPRKDFDALSRKAEEIADG